MSKRVLDLFCGAGGAGLGYAQAGYEVIGIDIMPQQHYPFAFIRADAMNPPVKLEDFDLVHASPPCQSYSKRLRHLAHEQPKFIQELRIMLQGHDYVIENVEGSPLDGITLCATAFNIPMRRHRVFETSFKLPQPQCQHELFELTMNYHNTKRRRMWKARYGETVMRSFKRHLGVEFMTDDEAEQCIPPQYTQFIGEHYGR